MSSPQPQKSTNSMLYVLGMGSGLGFFLVIPLIVFTFLGVWADEKLNTFPLMIILAVLIGMIVTGFNLYKVIIPFLEKRSKK